MEQIWIQPPAEARPSQVPCRSGKTQLMEAALARLFLQRPRWPCCAVQSTCPGVVFGCVLKFWVSPSVLCQFSVWKPEGMVVTMEKTGGQSWVFTHTFPVCSLGPATPHTLGHLQQARYGSRHPANGFINNSYNNRC